MSKRKGNPRRTNGSLRTKRRKQVASWGRPCALCGQPIDYTLTTYVDPTDGKRKPHPWSYELDEIRPVSKGGSPYDLDNLQPAHRWCNQQKGDGEGIELTLPTEERTPTSREW